jgi:hypothetical protein
MLSHFPASNLNHMNIAVLDKNYQTEETPVRQKGRSSFSMPQIPQFLTTGNLDSDYDLQSQSSTVEK